MKTRKRTTFVFLLVFVVGVVYLNMKTSAQAATPSLSQSTFYLSASSTGDGGAIFNNSATVNVYVTLGSSWLTAFPVGTTAFGFITTENTSASSRTGEICINASGTILYVTIIQAATVPTPTPTPAPQAYFQCACSLVDNQTTILDYNQTLYTMRFATNQNLTVRLKKNNEAFSTITMKKSNDIYEYTLNMSPNMTLTKVNYTIDVTVSGTNVIGGNKHTYYITQRAGLTPTPTPPPKPTSTPTPKPTSSPTPTTAPIPESFDVDAWEMRINNRTQTIQNLGGTYRTYKLDTISLRFNQVSKDWVILEARNEFNGEKKIELFSLPCYGDKIISPDYRYYDIFNYPTSFDETNAQSYERKYYIVSRDEYDRITSQYGYDIDQQTFESIVDQNEMKVLFRIVYQSW